MQIQVNPIPNDKSCLLSLIHERGLRNTSPGEIYYLFWVDREKTAHPASAASQLFSAQNKAYTKEAYFGVTFSDPLHKENSVAGTE